MSGFKDEKQLRRWMIPRMLGTWQPIECVYPAGHPDLMGSVPGQPPGNRRLVYVELKVAAKPSMKMMEPSQLEFIPWLQRAGQEVWVAAGSPAEKSVLWYYGLNFEFGDEQEPPSFWIK